MLTQLFTELKPSGWPGRAGVEETAVDVIRILADNDQTTELVALAPIHIAEQNNSCGLAGAMLDIIKGYAEAENDEMVGALAGTGLDLVRKSLDDAQKRNLEALAIRLVRRLVQFCRFQKPTPLSCIRCAAELADWPRSWCVGLLYPTRLRRVGAFVGWRAEPRLPDLGSQ